MVHVSAIANPASGADYARSKIAGEEAVLAAFPTATILRPSIVFGAEDSFFNRFAGMAAISPVLPIVSGGSKFQPVFVGDVADAVMTAPAGVYELGGPEVRAFRELIELMLKIIDRKRMILDLPLPLARIQAAFLERLPGKLLTGDQIELLQCDNVVGEGMPDLASLGIVATPMDLVLPSYLARYRPGGRRKESVYNE
jgi:NADH dehydrogenase